MIKLLSKNALVKILRNPAHAFKKGTERLKTQIAVSCLNGHSPFPKNLTFFLTYRCNLRCNVCGQWGLTGYAKKFTTEQLRDELDIETLKSVIDTIAPYKPEITLCGGEVFLYKDWYAFMCHVKSKGLTCLLTTNGVLLEENAEKLVDIGLDKLSLSLDGPPEVHNRARVSDQVYQKAIRGIQSVSEYKKKKNKNLPQLEIGCTISDQNYRHFDEIVDIAESLNVSCLIFLHLAFYNDEELNQQTTLFQDTFQTETIHWSGYRYDPGKLDVDFLADKIAVIKSSQRKMPIIFHPDFTKDEMKRYYCKPFFTSSSYKNVCLAPWTTAYVLPNGDISPCSSFVAGNIRHDRFKDIWNNKKYRHFRTELKKRKSFPACSRCCEFYKY